MPGFFKPGNQYGRGRPKISLSKPDILLPAIFAKANINWAADFTRLYKKMKDCTGKPLNSNEQTQFRMLMELLPYLIVKVNLKESDLKSYLDKGGAVNAAKATKALLDALENESNGTKPRATSSGQSGGVEQREPVLPPPTEPA